MPSIFNKRFHDIRSIQQRIASSVDKAITAGIATDPSVMKELASLEEASNQLAEILKDIEQKGQIDGKTIVQFGDLVARALELSERIAKAIQDLFS